MAAWQVEFHLVPRRALASAALTSAVLRDTDWWTAFAFPSDYQKRLAIVAPAAVASRPNVETWGTADGNRVDVWSDAGRVTRVMVTVDVRRLDSRFGAALLDFVRAADAVLVRTDGLVVEPIIGAYAGALRNSAAWTFASDPAAFLAANAKALDDDDDDDDA